MDDRTLALLGDRAAQERITERGELLPCPFCGNIPVLEEVFGTFDLRCLKYNCRGGSYSSYGDGGGELTYESEQKARLAWNTRAPIMSSEEMEMLDERSL